MKAIKSKYSSLAEWRKENPSAYCNAKKRGLIPSICNKFGWSMVDKVPNGYWTLEKCKEEALKYTTKVEWLKQSKRSCDAAYRHKWIDICTQHMENLHKPNGYWTKEKVLAEARKYTTIAEWNNKHCSSLTISKANGWHKECTEHMIEIQKPPGYWTKEKCLEDSKKYKTRREWELNNASSYGAARRLKIFDECIEHMIGLRKGNGYWTKERCIESASKYKSIGEWTKNAGGAVLKARRENWFKECSAHMPKLTGKRKNKLA
jgi:hypothetical protein